MAKAAELAPAQAQEHSWETTNQAEFCPKDMEGLQSVFRPLDPGMLAGASVSKRHRRSRIAQCTSSRCDQCICPVFLPARATLHSARTSHDLC